MLAPDAAEDGRLAGVCVCGGGNDLPGVISSVTRTYGSLSLPFMVERDNQVFMQMQTV